MGAPDASHHQSSPPPLPPWEAAFALVAPLFGAASGESKENDAPAVAQGAVSGDSKASVESAAEKSAASPRRRPSVEDDRPWWRPLFWSPTTGWEAHEALTAALTLVGCAPFPR